MNIVKIGIAWFRVYLRRTRNGCREREREREELENLKAYKFDFLISSIQ